MRCETRSGSPLADCFVPILARRGTFGVLQRLRPLMIPSDDDNTLIDACRTGKTEAFGVLVNRYQDRLYPTVLRLTGCAEDAFDLLQDTFLRAYEKLDLFHGG